MEKLVTRKEAAKILGISIATLDTAPQQWPDFLCTVCAEWLRLFYRRKPSGVHRKIHASGKAGGKVYHIPQGA